MTKKDAYGISFHARIGYDTELDLSDFGIGFFGPEGSGSYVPVGQWNSTTYIVHGDPWIPYAQIQNIAYHASNSGIVDGVIPLHLRSIPNYQATLNIRFDQDHPVRIFNARCNLYDGDDLDNPPYGWNARLAEVIHTSKIQTNTGTGDQTWHIASTGESISLTNNPGPTGAYAGRYVFDGYERHDWYVAISVSPEQVGSRTAGLNVYLEYL